MQADAPDTFYTYPTGTSTVALVLVTWVRVAFAHNFFQFLFFYDKLRLGLESVLIARFKVYFTVAKIKNRYEKDRSF